MSSAIEFGSPPPAVSSAIDYGGTEQRPPTEDSSSSVHLLEPGSGDLTEEAPPAARQGGRPLRHYLAP